MTDHAPVLSDQATEIRWRQWEAAVPKTTDALP